MICCYTDLGAAQQGKPIVVTAYFMREIQRGQILVGKRRVHHDRMGNPLTVWFDDPEKEPICEEIADDLVLMKDRRGRVLGFERPDYLSNKQRGQGLNIPVEIQVV